MREIHLHTPSRGGIDHLHRGGGQVLKHQGVLVEQGMSQGDLPLAFQLEGGLAGVDQAGVQQDGGAALGLRLLKADDVVLKGRLLVHGDVEPRMPSHGKGQGPVSGVLHGKDSGIALGVQPVLLTGDHENAAHAIASRLGIEEVHAACLPEDKIKCIDSLMNEGKKVCMVGDGINDAPALKKAYVGIAMGGVGSDIAVDAADIALVNDDIKELPHLFRLAKRMMVTIKCNLTFSMTLNFIAIVLAITGILNPVVGALVHNAGSVIVIINSALLLKWRKK